MLGITGYHSSIAQAYTQGPHVDCEFIHGRIQHLPFDCDEYLLCAGVLHGKTIREMDEVDLTETFQVNFSDIAKFCDTLFKVNETARVCVIGSESGVKGSFDMAYAGAKAALHLYVETKRLSTKDQHLVAVSPTIIQDAGMTTRRDDREDVILRGKSRRMQRWLKASEVARVAHFALQEGALSNTVIHITGGNW